MTFLMSESKSLFRTGAASGQLHQELEWHADAPSTTHRYLYVGMQSMDRHNKSICAENHPKCIKEDACKVMPQ